MCVCVCFMATQNTGVPIVPIEALFTEDEHQGTGYMQLPLYAHDLAAWAAASPRRTSTQLIHVVCNVRPCKHPHHKNIRGQSSHGPVSFSDACFPPRGVCRCCAA